MSLSDASPLAEKKNERIDLLFNTAEWVCSDLNNSAGQEANPTHELFEVSRSDISKVIDLYFGYVDDLKNDNKFGDHLINEAKQAALTVKAIMDVKPIKALRTARDTVHLAAANPWYAYLVALGLMNIEVGCIEKPDSAEIQYFIINKFNEDRMLMLMFSLLRRAYCKRWKWLPSPNLLTWKSNRSSFFLHK